jgi:hypothetical protein
MTNISRENGNVLRKEFVEGKIKISEGYLHKHGCENVSYKKKGVQFEDSLRNKTPLRMFKLSFLILL